MLYSDRVMMYNAAMLGLIGDYIIDEYITCSADRISPESPIPVFRYISATTSHGGAGNVERNLRALGAQVESHFPNMAFAPRKKRYVCDGHIVFRCDHEASFSSSKTNFSFDPAVKHVLLSDYNKGSLDLIDMIIDQLVGDGIKIIADIKRPIQNYRNAFLVKMNAKEHQTYCGGQSLSDISKAYDIPNIIVTQGDKGMDVYTNNKVHHLDVDASSVRDVTGAGDIVLAAIGHYIERGESVLDAAVKANKLAALSVSHFGTYVLTKDDAAKVERPTTVFTNGCFDIIHKGHVEYLRASKALGDRLVVGLNSDRSVRALKGSTRPINDERARKEVLESLAFVDQVIIFDDDTPYDLIKSIKPDIITKGGDYSVETVVGNDLAKVVIIPLVEDASTTKIIGRIHDKNR
jgi:D-beta-D-heptose 7-phosphate kinase/D-beta-D-heptose 1-phosphate adenosyltransferase